MPHSIGFGNDLLDTPPKAQVIKEKNFKLDFMKIKNFCSSKYDVKRMRRQAIDWDKIFAKDLSGKRLLSKIYEKLLKLNSKKTNNLI